MNRLIGYILGIIGIVGLAAWDIPQIKKFLLIPAIISDTILLVASLILIVLGLVIIRQGSSGKQPKEVPIFRGKNIVGYRRMK
jgi:sulfite exporter TauE/SafE